MKTFILYYSYTGSSKKYAMRLAEKLSADIEEIKDEKRPGVVAAYVAGCYRAMSQKPSKIQPIKADLSAYDRFVLIAPIWAGSPAPPFNSALAALPLGAVVELYLVSGSGVSKKEKLITFVQEKGFKLTDYYDVKQSEIDN